MKIIVECPCCLNEGLHIEVDEGSKVICTGRKLSEYKLITVCRVCKRKVKYDVKKEQA